MRDESLLRIEAINAKYKFDCTEDKSQEIERLRKLLALPKPSSKILFSPYLGLRAFTENDNKYFFGRNAEIWKSCQGFMMFTEHPCP